MSIKYRSNREKNTTGVGNHTYSHSRRELSTNLHKSKAGGALPAQCEDSGGGRGGGEGGHHGLNNA